MIRVLPTFKGYTVDVRLKEFRKCNIGEELEFISFESAYGDELLDGYIESLEADSPEVYELLNALWK